MEIYDYTVEKEESGIRIDRYLAEKDSGLSREHWSMQLWHIVVTAFPVLTE